MEPAQTWTSEPDRLLHVLASCVVFYVFIILLTRLSGKRTTGNMNNFDWIITVGIGSLMASGILLRHVSMLDAMLAVTTLAALQWLTTWGTMRSNRFAQWVKPRPRLLLQNGAMLDGEMRRERISRDEVEAALRDAGLGDCGEAAWVVIETNGQLTVIARSGQGRTNIGDLISPLAGGMDRDECETDDRGETEGEGR